MIYAGIILALMIPFGWQGLLAGIIVVCILDKYLDRYYKER